MEKIKNPIIIEGLLLLFSWIFGLMIDDTIQKNIIQYPESYNLHQFIQNFLNIDNVLTPIFVGLWIMGTLVYVFHKVNN
jgi:hypothetical protein